MPQEIDFFIQTAQFLGSCLAAQEADKTTSHILDLFTCKDVFLKKYIQNSCHGNLGCAVLCFMIRGQLFTVLLNNIGYQK